MIGDIPMIFPSDGLNRCHAGPSEVPLRLWSSVWPLARPELFSKVSVVPTGTREGVLKTVKGMEDSW